MNENQVSTSTVEHRSLGSILGTVQHSQQRFVLSYLSTHRGDVVSLTELVDALAQQTDTDQKEITINLHHHHLPRLEDEGFIRYDPVTNAVQVRELPVIIEQYLALAEG